MALLSTDNQFFLSVTFEAPKCPSLISCHLIPDSFIFGKWSWRLSKLPLNSAHTPRWGNYQSFQFSPSSWCWGSAIPTASVQVWNGCVEEWADPFSRAFSGCSCADASRSFRNLVSSLHVHFPPVLLLLRLYWLLRISSSHWETHFRLVAFKWSKRKENVVHVSTVRCS